MSRKTLRTTVGDIDSDVLAFTVGDDPVLDLALVDADCIGSAAHVTMLAKMPGRARVISAGERARVVRELGRIMERARRGEFAITLADQDVHLAVERALTDKLGNLGKRVHTARSRNDQVAVDLRLYAREQLLADMEAAAVLAGDLLRFGRRHATVPMVGRTHMQPAMPSSVGLWAAAHAESLLDDLVLLRSAYAINNRCPLGSAASYGVPLPIDRRLTSRLLGFAEPVHTVLYANNARGKLESAILAALGQVMLSLARLAGDLMLFTMPEFGYFALPADCCTGSSIMPQKRNPDLLELIRSRAARVLSNAACVAEITRGLPGGYNRDLQDTKGPFLEGMRITQASLRVLAPMVRGLGVNRSALVRGFTPDVFATDRALELVAGGMPFRDAYHYVKQHLNELRAVDPQKAVRRKTHLGAPAGVDYALLLRRARSAGAAALRERRACHRRISALLGVPYPPAR